MKPISVVIPVRQGGNPEITLRSLAQQESPPPFDVIVSHDESGFGDSRGANWARNRGAALCKSDFILFSDDDIEWESLALRRLFLALKQYPEASYAFGSYEMGGKGFCVKPFNGDTLRRYNIASTMALVRAERFPGFDESIARLQDWDLYLTMLARGWKGVHCGALTFRTGTRSGITVDGSIPYNEACDVIARKHGLRKRA